MLELLRHITKRMAQGAIGLVVLLFMIQLDVVLALAFSSNLGGMLFLLLFFLVIEFAGIYGYFEHKEKQSKQKQNDSTKG